MHTWYNDIRNTVVRFCRIVLFIRAVCDDNKLTDCFVVLRMRIFTPVECVIIYLRFRKSLLRVRPGKRVLWRLTQYGKGRNATIREAPFKRLIESWMEKFPPHAFILRHHQIFFIARWSGFGNFQTLAIPTVCRKVCDVVRTVLSHFIILGNRN